jgi:hypothetical protein
MSYEDVHEPSQRLLFIRFAGLLVYLHSVMDADEIFKLG